MRNSSVLRSAFPAALLGACAVCAHAGVLLVSPLTLTVGPGVASVASITTAPNDYPATSTANNITAGVTLNTMASPLDLVLQGVNSGGVTQYRTTVTVGNLTGTTLSSYAFQLGSGTAGAFVPFSGSGASTGVVSFLPTTPAPTSSNFSSSVVSNELLTFTGGSLVSGSTSTFSFNLAVPDFATTPYSFTLRELPQATPEPSAFAALGLGAMAIVRRRKRA